MREESDRGNSVQIPGTAATASIVVFPIGRQQIPEQTMKKLTAPLKMSDCYLLVSENNVGISENALSWACTLWKNHSLWCEHLRTVYLLVSLIH